MKKFAWIFILFLCTGFAFSADLKAKDIVKSAESKSNINESLSYLKAQVDNISTPSEKRAVLIFLASLQEQMSMFDDAQKSYVQAAGIAAGDAEDMPRKSNEQLVIDAVRCALSCGDYNTADSYLNSAVRNSKNEKIQAYVKLYAQWSALCKADDVSGIQEPVAVLQAYSRIDSMKMLQPAILLTLWYVTGDKSYSKDIISKYPESMETAIVNGDVQLLPTPFWFFVPKAGVAELGIGTFTKSETLSESVKPEPVKTESEVAVENETVKLQLGLFRTEKNAHLLADEIKSKGFQAYISSEVRASGTTYYLVLVNEDKTGTVADKLRSSGYECYAIE